MLNKSSSTSVNLKRKAAIFLLSVFTMAIFLSGCSGSNDTLTNTTSQGATGSVTNVTSTAIASSENTSQTESPLWKSVADATAEHSNFAAGFMDEKSGITVGYSGEIHYTTDGGKTWPTAVNNSACRWGLDIVNEKLVWSCGNSGNIRVSKDFGQNWDAVTDCMGPCNLISFIDDKTGWVASTSWMQATSDSGKTWKDVKIPEGLNDITAINLISANEGYILSHSGMFYSTKDGGKTWSSPKDLGVKELQIDNKRIPASTGTCAAMRFTDSNNGIIVFSGVYGTTGGNVWSMKTSDAGKTWTTKALDVDKMFYQSTVYLSHDGKFLTLRSDFNKIKVLLLK